MSFLALPSIAIKLNPLTYWDEALDLSTGGTPTSRNRLKEEKFLALRIPLPPLPEQPRIVARIEELVAKINEARGLREQAATEVDALALSYLSRTFAYDPGVNLPPGWSWMLLKDLLLDEYEGMTTGPFGTLLQKSDFQSEGVPVLGIPNVQANQFVEGFSDYVADWKAVALSSYGLKPGDIVIARSGTVGRSCVIPPGLDPMPIMSTNLMRLRLNPEAFLPDLLCRLFNGSRLVEKHKKSECRGSSRDFFTQKILHRLRIPTPPLAEQQRILAELNCVQSQVSGIKTLQTETAAELDALLPSILDKAFKEEL
jgi:type I restriction enzyme S subunit